MEGTRECEWCKCRRILFNLSVSSWWSVQVNSDSACLVESKTLSSFDVNDVDDNDEENCYSGEKYANYNALSDVGN
jgi:hypothetical protein